MDSALLNFWVADAVYSVVIHLFYYRFIGCFCIVSVDPSLLSRDDAFHNILTINNYYFTDKFLTMVFTETLHC